MSDTRDSVQRPTVDSDPGPSVCASCGETYTDFGDGSRYVCSDCHTDLHTCPECGETKQRHRDTCEECACDHPAAYVDESGAWDVQRCVECDEVVNRGGVENVPLRGD